MLVKISISSKFERKCRRRYLKKQQMQNRDVDALFLHRSSFNQHLHCKSLLDFKTEFAYYGCLQCWTPWAFRLTVVCVRSVSEYYLT